MSDYFDRVEQDMREAVRRGAHVPWYLRLRPRPSRPIAVALACLLVTGSALAATGVLRTGEPVTATVLPIPGSDEGVAIPGSARLLTLRVPDPAGGPPWGLRLEQTTRGLTCVQLGRIVGGRIGVLGSDGAFADDQAFHPLSLNFFDGIGCGTNDARDHAFVNEQIHGLPASGLLFDPHHTAGGCYEAPASLEACPSTDMRDVYFGLLGPDASSVTYLNASGGTTSTATVGADGAYLIVVPHATGACTPHDPSCTGGAGKPGRVHRGVVRVRVAPGGTSWTGGPDLPQSEVITAIDYRGGHRCVIATVSFGEDGSERCPAVGYVAASTQRVTAVELASQISAHVEPASHYCERSEDTIPCDGNIPKGYTRIALVGRWQPEVLLVIEFTARVAVTNFDSHYEIKTTDPYEPRDTQCQIRGGSGFGPTQTNLRAGQRVRYTMFVNPECRGITHITVGYVTVDGPSGATPVPGLPGQSGETLVGRANFMVP